jgi:hypothetical protein
MLAIEDRGHPPCHNTAYISKGLPYIEETCDELDELRSINIDEPVRGQIVRKVADPPYPSWLLESQVRYCWHPFSAMSVLPTTRNRRYDEIWRDVDK